MKTLAVFGRNRMPQKKIKRLFFDIETSPNIGLFWRPGFNLTITHENIINERKIICICYKWAGEKKVHSLQWNKNQDDKKMLEDFLPIMKEADEVVGHNCDRFDITWIRTRCIKHGIPMMPDYISIDTLKKASGRFNFNSNQLDYIAQYLGVGQKIKTEYALWKSVLLDNDAKALKKMVDYCKRDVVILERVWDKMNPYIKPKTSIATHVNDCPECGKETRVVKHRITANGYKRVQYQCKSCGKYGTMSESKYKNGKSI